MSTDFIARLSVVDLVLLAIIVIGFLLGYFQGAIRQVLGLFVWLLSFILAATVREPLGDFLARYWTNMPTGYPHMLAFLILFILFLVIGNILIQWRYRRTVIHSRVTVLDELLGGVLGAVLAILLIATAIIILDSFYARGGVVGEGDVRLLGQTQRALSDSSVGGAIRANVVTPLVTILAPLLPAAVTDVVRRR